MAGSYPQYRYRPDHRVSPAVWLGLTVRGAAHAIADVGVRPLEDSGLFCFITGCGHSGTTLLASKLGLHPEALLIGRESNIFRPTHGLRAARIILYEWLSLARQEGRAVILEKSPKHIQCVPRIRRLLPQSRLIVVVRNPLDTCASLYKRFGNLDFAIDRWRIDNEAALRFLADPTTRLVRYEELTRDPATVLANACAFLGLTWDPDLLTRSGSAYDTNRELGRTMITRTGQVSQPIRDNSGKWREAFDAAQASRVRDRTATIAARFGYALESA